MLCLSFPRLVWMPEFRCFFGSVDRGSWSALRPPRSLLAPRLQLEKPLSVSHEDERTQLGEPKLCNRKIPSPKLAQEP